MVKYRVIRGDRLLSNSHGGTELICYPNLQKIPDLAEKVGELKNWKQIGLIITTAMISSIFSGTIGGTIGWLLKGSNIRP